MRAPKKLKIFISSPGDVTIERIRTEQAVERLKPEFASYFDLETIRWEERPLSATEDFQTQIPDPSTADIVVVILWWRLGTPLKNRNGWNRDWTGPISKREVTGTEWEFENAIEGYQKSQTKPFVLVFQKLGTPTSLTDAEMRSYGRQKNRVIAFFNRWFKDKKTKTYVRAFREFRDETEFTAMIDEQLPILLKERIGEGTGKPAVAWPKNPFRGLQAFDVEDAPVFFGRTRAQQRLRALAEERAAAGRPWVLVTGASGSGKSSLIRAGFLPDICKPGLVAGVGLCRYVIIRPGDLGGDPVKALTQALLGNKGLPELRNLEYDAEGLMKQFAAGPEPVAFAIKQGLAAASAHLSKYYRPLLAIVVDQLEELFRLPKERQMALVDAFRGIKIASNVWVVATLRSDFLPELDKHPISEYFDSAGRFLLSAPTDVELGQIIMRPARAAGLCWESDDATGNSLDEVLLAAARRDPACLPLLEYVLEQLWQRRGSGGELGFSAYEELGGLEGAIAARAEEVFQALPLDAQAAVPRVLRRLVTMGQSDDARPVAETGRVNLFPEQTPERVVVDAMLAPEARLLIAGDGGTVRIAHEAVLTHWNRAAEQLVTDRRDLQLEARLRTQVVRWRDAAPAEKRSLLLPPGLPLAEAEDLLTRRGDEIDDEVVSLIQHSTAAHREDKERQRRIDARLRDGVRMAAVERVGDNPSLQVAILREVELPGEAPGWMQNACDVERQPACYSEYPEVVRYDRLSHLGLNHDGTILVGRLLDGHDSACIFWRTREAGIPRALPLSETYKLEDSNFSTTYMLFWVGMDLSQDRLLALTQDGTLHVIHFDAGNDPQEAPADTFVYGSDGSVTKHYQSVSLKIEKKIRAIPKGFDHERDPVTASGYSQPARRLVTRHKDGRLLVWNLASDSPPEIVIPAPDVPLNANIHLSSDGRFAALLDSKNKYGPSYLLCLEPDCDFVTKKLAEEVCAVAFHPNSSYIVAACGDGVARIWRIEGGSAHEQSRLIAGEDPLTAVAFSRDGSSVATGSRQGRLVIWPWRDDFPFERELAPAVWAGRCVSSSGPLKKFKDKRGSPDDPTVVHAHSEAIAGIVFDPAGRSVMVFSLRGTAQLWPSRTLAGAVLLRGHKGGVSEAGFSADGGWVFTSALHSGPRLWSTERSPDPLTLWPSQLNHSSSVDAIALESNESGGRVWIKRGFEQVECVTLDEPRSAERYSFWHRSSKDRSTWHDRKELSWFCLQPKRSRAGFFPVRGERKPFLLGGLTRRILGLSTPPDCSQVVAWTDNGKVYLWNAANPKTPVLVVDDGSCVTAAVFSRDGRWFATGSRDGTLRQWRSSASAKPKRLSGQLLEKVTGLEVSRDGKRMLAHGASEALLCSLTGTQSKHLDSVRYAGFVRDGQAVLCVDHHGQSFEISHRFVRRDLRRLGRLEGKVKAVAADGSWILTLLNDQEPLVWSTTRNLEPIVLHGAGRDVRSAVSSHDGKRIFTGDSNGVLRVWNVELDPEVLIQRLWKMTPFCLSVDERWRLLFEPIEIAAAKRAEARNCFDHSL